MDNFQIDLGQLEDSLGDEKLFGIDDAPSVLSIYKSSHYKPTICYGRFKANHGSEAASINQISKEKFAKSFYPKGDIFNAGKVFSAKRIISILDEVLGSDTEFKRSLDICCGSGMHALTYKLFGLADEVVGIDIINRLPELPTDAARFISDTCNSAEELAQQGNYSSLFKGVNHPHHLCESPWTMRNHKTMNDTSFEIDDYIVDNFLTTTKISGKFDLVTLYAGLEYFNQQNFFKKLSDLMSIGGIFFTVNDFYWEDHGSSMHLPTPPYLHAMMSESQFKNYFSKIGMEEESQIIESIYYFGDNHVTSKSQELCALEHGFSLKYQRRIPSYNGMSFPGLAKKICSALSESRTACPTPQFADLNTYYLLQVFEYNP